ncbi:hypothetical protein M0R45_006052 [Rubus argutus]|uniref:Uncharacterized protein n=1 Tax=Rubus argutus TaxID=59490 RepID=A0AAW1YPA3_RUBAR
MVRMLMELHGRVVVLNGSRLGCCEFGTVVDLNCDGGNEAMVRIDGDVRCGFADAGLNGSELVYRVEKKGGLVNAVTNQKSDVWIQLSKEPRLCAPGSEEDEV